MRHKLINGEKIPLTAEEIAAEDNLAATRQTLGVFAGAFDGTQIDLEKAKDICRAEIRAKRAIALPLLDVAFNKAQDAGTSTTTISSQRQAWRDAPNNPTIDAAADIETLKTILQTYE